MKHYAIILALCATSSAYGQRLIDLEAKLTSPVPNAVIQSGVQFTVSFTIKNVGTTPLKATDTIAYFYTLDGNGEDYDNDGKVDVYATTGTQLAPNATAAVPSIGITYTIPASLNGTNHQYGVGIMVVNRSADSAKDNNINNNVSANPVKFAGTTSVDVLQGSVVKNNVLAIYPNPATTEVNAKVALGATTDVSYRLTDITGRTVLSGSKDNLGKGEHIIHTPLPGLIPGLYFYQLVIGNAILSTEKLYIIR